MSAQALRELTQRAQKLATTVESATKISNNANVRREGARLGEVLEEWLDDIKGLLERQDATLGERVESFETRLRMAEGKVDRWNVPAALIEKAQAAPKRKSTKRAPEPELEVEEDKPWYADDLDEIPMSNDAPPSAAKPAKKSSRAA